MKDSSKKASSMVRVNTSSRMAHTSWRAISPRVNLRIFQASIYSKYFHLRRKRKIQRLRRIPRRQLSQLLMKKKKEMKLKYLLIIAIQMMIRRR